MVLADHRRLPRERFLPFRGPGPQKVGFSQKGNQWCLLFLSSPVAAYSLPITSLALGQDPHRG